MIARAGRIHPLTGDPKDAPRPSRLDAHLMAPVTRNRRATLSYDSARSGTDLDGHWRHADSLDADSANNPGVRDTLRKRSRYEDGSNGYYAGILNTHCTAIVGTGPSLRMLTKSRGFNQLVEREWFEHTQKVQFRRKLWAMCHARIMDGEAFAILQNNPSLDEDKSQLDLLPIEAEQCQTPFGGAGVIDGIITDEFNNVIAYDVLPEHPGSGRLFTQREAIQVPASSMLHWFKLARPGAHRGKPELTSTLNVGASSRRWREATVAAAETAADIAAMLVTNANAAGGDEPDPMAPFSGVEFTKRMMTALPMGWDARQMKGEHPNAQYAEFNRSQISEQARPISMPFNAAACDSSTYSFASGKLDTLGYWAGVDVDRADCNDTVCEPYFDQWFKEWNLARGRDEFSEAATPAHQWDWPAHPVIDAVAESNSRDTDLKNGSRTFRQVYSDAGMDYEDQLIVMAEDWFGDPSEENVTKARQIQLLRCIPAHAIPYVSALLSADPKGALETYGVAVRAGALTPQPEDESHFRALTGLPPIAPATTKAWERDANVRRPITLANADGSYPNSGFGQSPAPNGEPAHEPAAQAV